MNNFHLVTTENRNINLIMFVMTCSGHTDNNNYQPTTE